MYHGFKEIADGIDSKVFSDGKSVMKIYKAHITKDTLRKYHEIQSFYSQRISKMVILIDGKKLKILDIGDTKIIEGENGLTSRLPFIEGKTAENLLIKPPKGTSSYEEIMARERVNSRMRILISNVRNSLNDLGINYPEALFGGKGICPSNIKVRDSDIIITDLGNDVRDFVLFNQTS